MKVNSLKQNIGILSLGCPRNLVDTETILGRLNLKGCKIVDMEKADIGIVNTCSFIEDAKTESIDAILDLVELKRGEVKKNNRLRMSGAALRQNFSQKNPRGRCFYRRSFVKSQPQAFFSYP